MVAFKNLFFLITAASALVLPRADFNDVLNDLKQADADTNQLTTQLNAYSGSGIQTLQIRQQITKLKNDLNNAISDTDASPVPTASQAQTIIDYIKNPLLPDVKTTLTAAKNKRSTFTTAGVKGEVLQNLKDLKSLTDSLADKLIAKAPTQALKDDGASTKAAFDAAFDDAIAYFS